MTRTMEPDFVWETTRTSSVSSVTIMDNMLGNVEIHVLEVEELAGVMGDPNYLSRMTSYSEN